MPARKHSQPTSHASLLGAVLGIVFIALALLVAVPVAVNLPESWPGALVVLALACVGVALIVAHVLQHRRRPDPPPNSIGNSHMIAIRLKINNEPAVVAGNEELTLLTAAVTCSGKLGPNVHPEIGEEVSLSLHLGGMTARREGVREEFLDWIEQADLKVGDKVTIEILEQGRVAPVSARMEAALKEQRERQGFELAKEMYFRLRDKYES